MKNLTLPGLYENLAIICEYVRQAAEQAGLSEKAAYEVETAVDEAFANIIDHAYGGEGKGDIECSCLIDEKGLTIQLRDHGHEFNPSRIKPPNIKAPLSKRKDRGLGLYLMRQWMDVVTFEFSKTQGNLLTMVKYRESNN